MDEQGLVPVGKKLQFVYKDQLESTLISRMCEDPDVGIGIASKLNGDHFGKFRDGFMLAKGMLMNKREVSILKLRELMKVRGYSEHEITEMLSIGLNKEDTDFVIEEVKRISALRLAYDDLKEMQEKVLDEEDVRKVAGEIISRSNKWTLGAEKKLYTLRETLNEPQVVGEHLKMGIPICDNEFFSEAGFRRGTWTGLICRQKHGKTRWASWATARVAMQQEPTMYVALEGTRHAISRNTEQVLGELVMDYANNMILVDGVNDVNEIMSLITEAVLVHGVKEVTIDYFNLMEDHEYKGSSYNDKALQIMNKLTKHAVNFNYAGLILSQARKKSTGQGFSGGDRMPAGWSYQPTIHDAYGSQALSNSCAVILTGFRPNMVDGLSERNESMVNPDRDQRRVLDFEGSSCPYTSFFVYMEANREGADYLHKYLHFIDSNRGLHLQRICGGY